MHVSRIFLLAVLFTAALPDHAVPQDRPGRNLLAPLQTTAAVVCTAEGADCFQLFSACLPMSLLVEDVPPDAANMRLTRSRIRTMAESRLRAARLYDPEAEPYLYIRVGVLLAENRRTGAYSIEVSYNKRLQDLRLSESNLAETWDSGSYGMHGADANYVLQSLSEHLDNFILEYLRINEESC